MKVFIVQSSRPYELMFEEAGWEVVDNIKDSDLVLFTGGYDVNPKLYGHAPHPATMFNTTCDIIDAQHHELATREGKPMVGICRGGQFLNVCNGGTMVQHCLGHATGAKHQAYDTTTGATIDVTSTHHQMMIPAKHGVVVATANEATCKEVMEDGAVKDINDTMVDDIEVVLYRDSNSLCFQPHPEFNGAEQCREYFFACLSIHLGLAA